MTIFIQALNYNLWDIIMDGPNIPTTIVDCKGGLPKLKNEYTIFDKRNLQLNARAMHVFYCALGPNEFNRIRSCLSAKEIWDKLESTHEGTNQVKDSIIDMLIHKYELFEMRHYKSIYYMFDRFTNIINLLNSLGKSFSNNDLVRKILRSLPKSLRDKVSAIEEANDLTMLKFEDLLGSLLTHELAMWRIEHGNEDIVVF
ncbi:UBN2 domain-containing protein [Cephalotus follicularis]|uniref:UBN2 domain-containing protein n=1 Tax=Cephalotus follicularis TaxID=3775 RepID=A0A1Q3CLH1_CEPFO|nr:UBN2 domain-containing protein [Cephalotus follicularis]